MRQLKLRNVHMNHADGGMGWEDRGPFDGILATAAPERIPEDLLQQLAPGGRLVLMPAGRPLVMGIVNLTPDSFYPGSRATGVAAALRVKGSSNTRVVAQGGDGGTTDIGFGCLSGMFERNDDVLYICYDNEAYMNTGVQRSSATPPAARTATSPAVGASPGNVFGQGKNVPLIAMAHEIPYVATASVADVRDLEAKVTRAMSIHGARYIHVLVPCPLGWGSAPQDTVRLARLATESGLFPVFEAEHGEITDRSRIRRRVPVVEYLKLQRRFAHVLRNEQQLARIQAVADTNDRERHVVQRGERVLTVLNRYPYNNGHLLVAPRVHRAGLDEYRS